MPHYPVKAKGDTVPAFLPTHPQAIAAIWLARRLKGAPEKVITQALETAGVPRSLFVKAATLQVAPPTGGIINDFA